MSIKEIVINQKSLLTLCSILISFSYCYQRTYEGLLTWEEYLKTQEKKPYVLELTTSKASLVYYGSLHRVDPRCPQFVDIEKRWKKFKPTMVLCYFMPDKIKLYYILRQVVINRNMKKDIKNTNYVCNILRELSSLKGFKGNPSTFDEFKLSVHKALPGLKKWQSIPCSYFYSDNPENFLPKIHLNVNEFRDHHMIKILLNELKKGKRVFAVVGRSHVVKQEPVLRSEVINF